MDSIRVTDFIYDIFLTMQIDVKYSFYSQSNSPKKNNL